MQRGVGTTPQGPAGQASSGAPGQGSGVRRRWCYTTTTCCQARPARQHYFIKYETSRISLRPCPGSRTQHRDGQRTHKSVGLPWSDTARGGITAYGFREKSLAIQSIQNHLSNEETHLRTKKTIIRTQISNFDCCINYAYTKENF